MTCRWGSEVRPFGKRQNFVPCHEYAGSHDHRPAVPPASLRSSTLLKSAKLNFAENVKMILEYLEIKLNLGRMAMTKNNENKTAKIIGYLNEEHIKLLGLSFEPSPILLGLSNEQHMQNEHPADYQKYFERISDIIRNPDYIGKHPSNGSIKYIKTIDEHILVAVRISAGGKLFARSIYAISAEKLEHYIRSGLTIKI